MCKVFPLSLGPVAMSGLIALKKDQYILMRS